MEICVTGDECCDGSSRSSDEKEFQYFCSDVRVEGPFGSFKGCSSWTSAAIAYRWACRRCECLEGSGDDAAAVIETFWWSLGRSLDQSMPVAAIALLPRAYMSYGYQGRRLPDDHAHPLHLRRSCSIGVMCALFVDIDATTTCCAHSYT
jgi:hypothetical protein